LLTHGLTYRLHNLCGKPNPSPDVLAAIAIGAPVRLRPKELIEKISVTSMNFHTRRADLFGGQGSADEGFANRIQVFPRGGASVGFPLVNQSGGA
jgi:hypothetical protein